DRFLGISMQRHGEANKRDAATVSLRRQPQTRRRQRAASFQFVRPNRSGWRSKSGNLRKSLSGKGSHQSSGVRGRKKLDAQGLECGRDQDGLPASDGYAVVTKRNVPGALIYELKEPVTDRLVINQISLLHTSLQESVGKSPPWFSV